MQSTKENDEPIDETIAKLQADSAAPHEITDLLPHERRLFSAYLIGCVQLQLTDTEIIQSLHRMATLCKNWLETHQRRERHDYRNRL